MIRVVRWRDFQHYSGRHAPWVKVYANLLDDREYRALPKDARAMLIDIWLLASKTLDGCLQLSSEDIAWRLRESVGEVRRLLAILASVQDANGPKWLELDPDASKMLAGCKQDACVETETETETEHIQGGRRTKPTDDPDPAFSRFWAAYPSRGGASNPKAPAAKWFAKRVAEGVSPETMIAQAGRYATWCAILGRVRTPLVMQATRWLGDNERAWEPADRWEINWKMAGFARTDEERTAIQIALEAYFRDAA